MSLKVAYYVIFLIFKTVVGREKSWSFVGNPLAHAYACKGNDNITMSYESGRPPGEENQYSVHIREYLPNHSAVTIKFNEDATVTLSNASYARVTTLPDQIFKINFFKDGPPYGFGFHVKGPASGAIPYITSLNINTVEYCEEPDVGVLDSLVLGVRDTAETHAEAPNVPTCGRRIITHTELITNGAPTKPGDWPWHVALYRFESNTLKYKCGGTLISKSAVLTAAHCTTIRGVPLLPDAINVVLGKYNLFGGDIGSQEREVLQVIVHDDYNATNLNHDISILKLKTEAVYSDYVQPACVWEPNAYKKLPYEKIDGTVVGWGFNQKDLLSTELRQATIPKVSDASCLRSNPVFFGRLLNQFKFCAGFRNGTSACNGDSGGGFLIFVPDKPKDTSKDAPGSWYIRGIVSVGVSRADANICDPTEYSLFTDIAKYRQWIQSNLS